MGEAESRDAGVVDSRAGEFGFADEAGESGKVGVPFGNEEERGTGEPDF